jgi:hypothetical protein
MWAVSGSAAAALIKKTARIRFTTFQPTNKQNRPDAVFRCAKRPMTGPAEKTRIIR